MLTPVSSKCWAGSSGWNSMNAADGVCNSWRASATLTTNGSVLTPRRYLAIAAAGERVLELAHPLADRAAGVGQPLGAEHHEGDDQHDDELHGSDSRHADQPLMNGLTAARTSSVFRDLSNA